MISSQSRRWVDLAVPGRYFFLGLVTTCWLINLALRFPGVSSFDTDFQYSQAVSGYYMDWHPPIMAFLWSGLRLISDGNGPLYFLHVSSYWLGFYLIADALRRGSRPYAAWIALAVAVCPVFLMLNVELYKDTGMAVALLVSFAIPFWYRSQNRKIPTSAFIAALVFLIYGLLVRTNGVFGGAVILVYLVQPKLFYYPIRLLAVSAVIVGLTIPTADLINHKLLHAVPTYPIRSLQVFDLAGIAYYSNDPSVFGSDTKITQQQISTCYVPALWDMAAPNAKCGIYWDSLAVTKDPTWAGRSGEIIWQLDPPDPALGGKWLAAIARHPLAYVQHRIANFNTALDFVVPRHAADRRVLNRIVYGIPLVLEPMGPVGKAIDYLKFNPLFTPIFALVLGALVLLTCLRQAATARTPLTAACLCLVSSGLLYCLGFLLVGISSEFRYQFWTMLAIFIAAALCIIEHRNIFFQPSRQRSLSLGILVATFVLILVAQTAEGDAFFATV